MPHDHSCDLTCKLKSKHIDSDGVKWPSCYVALLTLPLKLIIWYVATLILLLTMKNLDEKTSLKKTYLIIESII